MLTRYERDQLKERIVACMEATGRRDEKTIKKLSAELFKYIDAITTDNPTMTVSEMGRLGGTIGGAKGGVSTSDAKRKAAAENGKKGGRPRTNFDDAPTLGQLIMRGQRFDVVEQCIKEEGVIQFRIRGKFNGKIIGKPENIVSFGRIPKLPKQLGILIEAPAQQGTTVLNISPV